MAGQKLFDFNWMLAVIRRWLWPIIGLMLLTAVIAYIAFSLMPAEYTATVTMMVDPRRSAAGSSQYNELIAAERVAYTYSQMVKDRSVMDASIAKLGMNITPAALASKVEVVPIPETQLLQLVATGASAEEATLVANTVAEAFTAHVQELSAQRFKDSVNNTQAKVDLYQAETDTIQKEIDAAFSKRTENEQGVARLQTALTSYQSDLRFIQQNYQDLQLTIAQTTGTVHIVEPAEATQVYGSSLKSATVIMSLGSDLPNMKSNLNNDRVVLSYGQLLLSNTLIEGVTKELGINESPALFARRIHVDLVPGTELLRMRVDDVDTEKAKVWADALANAFLTKVKSLLTEPYSDRLSMMEKQLGEATGKVNTTQDEINKLNSQSSQLTADLERLNNALSYSQANYQAAQSDLDQLRVTIAQSADAVSITEIARNARHANNNRELYVFLAAVVAMVLGIALAFLLDFLDDRIRTRDDIAQKTNLPILGTIEKFSNNEMVVTTQPHSSAADAFRGLGAKIRLLSAENSLRTLLVTSPTPNEGKSVVVANLAASLAKTGLRVIAVDADLWLPRLHLMFGMPQSKGLNGLLADGTYNGVLTEEIKPTDVDHLQIITSGDSPTNPTENLTSANLESLFSELSSKADIVLVDCPPILSAADTSILASKVDGVLLVMRSGVTEFQAAQDAINALEQVKAKIIGVVLNGVLDKNESYRRYYYGHVSGKKNEQPLHK